MTLPCATCGHTNRDGARFCAECGAELARTCATCGAALSPGARFCDACGAAAGRTDESGAVPGLESRKVLTVVFADLAGSTALQEQLDAESARRVMTRFYEQMRAVLQAHGGVLEKFIGDAVVALFGRPAVGEDDALRAVRAAAAMVVELESLNGELERSWGVRLRMRTGVNTGELVVSDTGALVGDMMNTAARLENAAPEGEVLIGEQTWRLVRHAVELEEVAPLKVKGKLHPLRAWRVVSVAVVDRRRTAAVQAPLVGRVRELARLRAALDEVLAARACRLVSVIGSPGVGKSRLAREFGAAVAGLAAVVEGHCEPTGEGITLLPVAEILRAVAAIGEADPADLVREKLAALVPEDDPDRERLVERSAGVLGVVEPASAQETFWALRRGVEFLAREQPLVLVLDDLHLGQPLLLDLVEHLVEWVRDAPVLLVALARPELRDVREALVSGRRAADVIELEPLDERESLELVDGLLGEVRVPAGLRARILDVTEGNPLFLGETLRMLVDEGALQREGDVWVPAEGLDAIEVPPTIQALLAARIERLRADERSVVERASVIGKQFYRGAVAELVAPPVASGIDAHLEALRRKDMVEPEGTYWIDEPVYRFHHVLIRDAAYRSLLKEARADLHERFAHWLEVKAGELVGEHEEVIAFHLEQAHEYRRQLGPLDDRGRALGTRAAERLGSAGRRALAREDLAAAANLLSRALARDAGEESRLLWDLCDAVLSAGDTASAAPLVGRYADACGDGRADAVRAQVLHGQLANLTGAPNVSATALALTDAAATLAEQGDREGEARAHQVAAGAYARLGQVGAVEEELDQALAAARRASDRRRTTAVLAAAPRAALWGPSPVVRASGRCLDVVRILRMTPGNRHVEAVALRCQAVLEAMRGRASAAREILAACRTTLEELGLAFELNETAVHAGIVELLADDPRTACEQLRAARAGFEALGAGAGAAQAAALLARALMTVDDPDALAEAIEQSEFAEAQSGEDLKTVIIWTSARAQALVRSGDVDGALSLARRAMSLAEPTDALADKGDAALALADVLLAAGQGEPARKVAESAAGWYEAKGHTVGVERCRHLVGTAAPGAVSVSPRPAAPSPTSVKRAVLADRPPERYWREFKRRFDAHDLDGLLELMDEGRTLIDHRKLGWDAADGIGETRDALGAAFSVSPDVRLEIDEVLACDEHVIAAVVRYTGHGADGSGEFEAAIGSVAMIANGRLVHADRYEPDDRDAMLARFGELSGSQGVLGDRPPERHIREWTRRWEAGDLNAVLAIFADDWVLRDHRGVRTMEELRGLDDARRLHESLRALSSDIRLEIDEVLACDDRMIAYRHAWRGTATDGGGSFEAAAGFVTVIEDGLERSVDQFDSEDRSGMIARYVELGGGLGQLGDRPPERWFKRLAAIQATRDRQQLPRLYSEAYRFHDHRLVGWEPTTSRQEATQRIESIWDGATDVHLEVHDVLACDDRAVALRLTWEGGTKADVGGGRFAFPLCAVVWLDGEEATCWDQYEPEDEEGALARYAELGGGQEPLGRARFVEPTREADEAGKPTVTSHRDWLTRHDEWLADDGSHCVAELIDLEAVVRDRRGFPATDRTGIEAYRELVGPGTATEMIASEEACLLARREDDPPLYLVAEIRGARLVEAVGLRDEERAREWFVSLVTWRRFEQAARVGDIDGLVAHLPTDGRIVDHRPLRFQGAASREALRDIYVGLARLLIRANASVDVLEVYPGATVVSLRWSGTDRDSGGPVEWLTFHASRVRDGLYVESHTYADADSALAKLEELSPVAAGTRIARDYVEAINAEDFDALLALYTEDCVLVDHRPLGSMQDVDSSAGLVASYQSWKEKQLGEVTVRAEILVDAGGPFFRQVFGGAWQGGTWEIATDTINTLRDGRISRVETFDPGQADARRARAAELRGRLVDLAPRPNQPPQRPPERYYDEWIRRWDAHDLDGVVDLYAEDWVMRDHRNLKLVEDHRRRAQARVLLASIRAMSEDLRLEIDEVLACDERVHAARIAWRGTARDGGGQVEVLTGFVTVVEDGRQLSLDQYDVDDYAAMIARYAELGGGQGPLGDHPPAQLYVEFARRYARRDLDGMVELYADEFVLVDHRRLGWDEVSGREGVRALTRSGFDNFRDLRFEVDEVLACDDRVIAIRIGWRGHALQGGGAVELQVGSVGVVEDGRLVRVDQYGPEDREAMLARSAELSGHDHLGRPRAEMAHREWIRHYNAHSLSELVACYSADVQLIDHRQLGWGVTESAAAAGATLSSAWEIAPDLTAHTDEILAADDRVLALNLTLRGHDAAQGGEFEYRVGSVQTHDQTGRIIHHDIYDYDDRGVMIARYAELGGGHGALGGSEPERWCASYVRNVASRDLDSLARLYAADYVLNDRRALGWETVRGPAGVVEQQRSGYETTLDLRAEIDEVLACGERMIAFRMRYVGHSIEGGGAFEISAGWVQAIEDGRARSTDIYEPGDREGMLARFAELSVDAGRGAS